MAKEQTIIIKKVKKGGGHGHHGGAWKVAYADFVTAMMAFFLVMWLMGSDEEIKAAVSHYFNHPNTPYKSGRDPDAQSVHPMGESEGTGDNVLQGTTGLWPEDLLERPVPERTAVRENRRISLMIEDVLEGEVEGVEFTPEFVKFSLPDEVLFETGSTQLTDKARRNLDFVAQVLTGFKGYLKIAGNTDEKPERGSRYTDNWELSFARALTVMNYLSKKGGLDESKMIPVGNGSRRSVAAVNPSEKQAKSRRVEFTLSYKDDVL